MESPCSRSRSRRTRSGKTTITIRYYHAPGADRTPTADYQLFDIHPGHRQGPPRLKRHADSAWSMRGAGAGSEIGVAHRLIAAQRRRRSGHADPPVSQNVAIIGHLEVTRAANCSTSSMVSTRARFSRTWRRPPPPAVARVPWTVRRAAAPADSTSGHGPWRASAARRRQGAGQLPCAARAGGKHLEHALQIARHVAPVSARR